MTSKKGNKKIIGLKSIKFLAPKNLNIDKVASSIKEFGFQQPIVVDKKNVIIVGHTRYEAAKKLGLNMSAVSSITEGLLDFESSIEKQMEAQQEISKLAIAKERLKLQKGKFSQQEARMEQKTVAPQPWDTPPQPQPTIDPRAEDWAQDNKWFGTDRPMTYTAMSFHEDLVNEGFDVSTEEYYNEINKRIRKEFPHKFEDQSKPKQRVASATRTTATGRRTVKLTPSQVAIAQKLGVPLEEYAKHVKEA